MPLESSSLIRINHLGVNICSSEQFFAIRAVVRLPRAQSVPSTAGLLEFGYIVEEHVHAVNNGHPLIHGIPAGKVFIHHPYDIKTRCPPDQSVHDFGMGTVQFLFVTFL